MGKETLYGAQIQNLRESMERKEFTENPGGKRESYAIIPPYHEHLRRDVPSLARPLKVVIDAGSGVAGPVAPPVFRNLGCQVWEIACEMDGRFPIHYTDPTIPENLELLIDKVKKEKAHV